MIGNNIQHKNDRGLALLYAVTMTGILLVVIFSVTSLIVKSLESAAFGRNSQEAFHAAQDAVDCTILLDVVFGAFPRSGKGPKNLFCTSGGEEFFKSVESVGGEPPTSYVFSFRIEFPETNRCADVTVEKHTAVPSETTIEARGYNTCDENDPKRVERGYRAVHDLN